MIDKPLKDWTTEEVMVYCAGKMCSACDIRVKRGDVYVCRFGNGRPSFWDISVPCQLTEPELAICRALGVNVVTKDKDGSRVYLWRGKPSCGYSGYIAGKESVLVGIVLRDMFPTVHDGDFVVVPDG